MTFIVSPKVQPTLMTMKTKLTIMKKIYVIALLSALALFPLSNSFAAWKELGSNERMVVYVDLDTISDVGEKAQIMSMLDFKKPGMNPKTKQPVSSIIGINEYNCPTVSYRPIEYKEFAGNKGAGKVVSDNKTPKSEFEPVVSESWAAGVFNVVCQRK
jgi:hypothetical protein